MNRPSGLAETPSGLAVIRTKDFKGLRPSMLPEDELNVFLRQFDAYVSARRDDRPWEEIKSLRRVFIKTVAKIRTAKSKTIDDILFKASLAEVIDHYECHRSATLARSIVNDLLSAVCEWRA